MRVFRYFTLCVGAALVAGLLVRGAMAADFGSPKLEIVAQMKQRPGNIAVADNGRMFISVHPFDSPTFKVLEVESDGTTKPYPNETWSAEPAGDGVGLANVIHLVTRKDRLYILDMGNDRVQPKLVAWNIAQNKLEHVWYIPRHAITGQSFLQDFVITPDEKDVFIADMGQADLVGPPAPAIVHLSLETGMAQRMLAGSPSLRPSVKPMVADGTQMNLTKEGKEYPLYLALNPITMDAKGTWLYFGPMGQGSIYKVQVADMLDPGLAPEDLAKKLQVVGTKPPSDGILVDGQENIFITSVADGAIGVMNNRGKYSTWLRDPLLSWPDGLAFGPDQGVYVTVNQLHLAPPFNKGEEHAQPPYMIVRIMGGRPMDKAE